MPPAALAVAPGGLPLRGAGQLRAARSAACALGDGVHCGRDAAGLGPAGERVGRRGWREEAGALGSQPHGCQALRALSRACCRAAQRPRNQPGARSLQVQQARHVLFVLCPMPQAN